MLVVVDIKGESVGKPWQYANYTYSCTEYSRNSGSCCGEGEFSSCKTSESISTHILFIATCITPDIKQQFFSLLEEKLRVQFSMKLPDVTELETLAKEIKGRLMPSLKNLCFKFFQTNKRDSEIKNPAIAMDLQEAYGTFKLLHRDNECW